MGYEDDGEPPLGAEAGQQGHDAGCGGGIEGRGDLVAEQHVGCGRQRAGDGHALALTS